MKKEINEEYFEQLLELISILHDLKHEGKLPKELENYRSWIEFFSPHKLFNEEEV